MRLRPKPWAEKEFTENPCFIQSPKNLQGRWQGLFANQNPIYLEIGCGKGRFIVETALANPNTNFLAMEKQEQIICMALRRARNTGPPPNLRLFCASAENLAELFAPNELSRIYINFCDPWRARGKWRKRRLTHRGFLATYEDIMQTPQVHFKTDDKNLFTFSLQEFEACDWQLTNHTTDLANSQFKNNIMTEYEERFATEGKPICRLEAQKTK